MSEEPRKARDTELPQRDAEDDRPDPDELLNRLQSEEERQFRGKLKIFMGYAAGVGKTYAMLEAARQRQAENVDVVVAYVETHKRIETEALLQGLEIVERKKIEYHGVQLSEMDVDAVLARNPKLALVDELAHTNAPGSRHLKRFQDVEELLDAGIDVYSTLNVQHLESLNDVVQQITGVTVRETVPDKIVEEAEEIELIDLAPDELLQRLKEGKVYVPEQAARAIQQFFRKGNLTALREISMRRAAQRVDVQMRDYMETKAIPGPWPAKDRLMVAISSHPLSERLVRAGRRLAEELDAEWFAVYVETPERLSYSPDYNERLGRTLRLAESLGAKVMSISGRTVPDAIIDFAHKYNITKIIAGKPLRPRWHEWLRGSLLDEIIRKSGPIDVYVISDLSGPLPRPRAPLRRPIHWRSYLYSILLVTLITGLGFLLRNLIVPTNLAMVYLAEVVFAAAYLGRGPSLLASLLSALSFDFFFVDPHYSFTIQDTQYIITFLGLLVVSLVISNLAGLVRNQVEASQRHAALTSTLYSLSRDLTRAIGLDGVLQMIVAHISQTFSREIVILLPHGKELEPRASSPDFVLDENEHAVAVWAFEHNQPAGRGTDTLSGARIRYQPLVTAQGVVGVIGVKPGDPGNYLTPDQRQLLDAYANLAALAIERAQLAEQASQAQVLQATEKLQTALLNSISHDLRTPLVSITGALDSLLEADGTPSGEQSVILDQEARIDLLQTAHEEADRLNRLVGNLLNMTRLESGALKLSKSEGDVQDMIGVALAHLPERLKDHPVQTSLPPDLPLVPVDFVLMDQVLVNILDNAAKYSEAGKPIEIQASQNNGSVEIAVSDRGIGIPAEDLTRVFDKFFRVQRRDDLGGTGLGLSICKGIVEAHGGRIWAENRPGGGTILRFTLPLEGNTGVSEEFQFLKGNKARS